MYTGTMKYCLSLCCVFIFLSDSESLSTRTLTFEDDRCFGPFHPSPRENFKVTHTGLDSSGICRDMSFSGWDYDDSLGRESCIKVNSVKLDCSQKFVYRTDSNRAKPVKTYDCYDTADTIPVFCTFDLLYIRIQTEEVMKNTEVVYTVYSGKEKPRYESESRAGWVVPTIISLGLIGLILTLVCCIRIKKARELQNQGGLVAYNRNQQPQTHIYVHHYHPVQQSRDQEVLCVNKDMRPGQPLHGQEYNLPPDTSHRFQSYPQPTAPTVPGDYEYPPRQHFSSSNTSDSPRLQQYRSDIKEPPPYDEVTKQYV